MAITNMNPTLHFIDRIERNKTNNKTSNTYFPINSFSKNNFYKIRFNKNGKEQTENNNYKVKNKNY